MTYKQAMKLKPMDKVRDKFTDEILFVEQLDCTIYSHGESPLLRIFTRNKHGVTSGHLHRSLELVK